jgi:hypothetical protein
MENKKIQYMCAISIGIRVACSLYKLAHGTEYFQCSEMFAIGKSIMNSFMSSMLFSKIRASGKRGGDLLEVMIGFKNFSGLPFVHGAIDVVQVHVYKPKGPFA